MKKLLITGAFLLCALPLTTEVASATEPLPTQAQPQEQKQEQIYGSQLMTDQERVEYRARMRATKTPEEREQIRKEHHQAMRERAKAQGLTLPDEPPVGGGLRGQGMGMGPGGGRGR